MTVYLNWRGSKGRETVDEFTRGVNAPSEWREFRRYIRAMVREYAMCGVNVYQSSRPCSNWS